MANVIGVKWSECNTSSHTADQPELESPESTGVNDDIKMNEPEVSLNPSSDPPVFESSQPGSGQLCPGQYIEIFGGCGETFPGGRTFMEEFWADQYVDQHRENISTPGNQSRNGLSHPGCCTCV